MGAFLGRDLFDIFKHLVLELTDSSRILHFLLFSWFSLLYIGKVESEAVRHCRTLAFLFNSLLLRLYFVVDL